MEELKYPVNHEWHVSINKHSANVGFEGMCFMYEAKAMASEVPRLARLFAMERQAKLPKEHKQCSMSPKEPIVNNHLKCCLGKVCAECPHLKALDGTQEASLEQIDLMKAWTCATHIVSQGGDVANEGYVLTTGDIMFWERVHTGFSTLKHTSLAGGDSE